MVRVGVRFRVGSGVRYWVRVVASIMYRVRVNFMYSVGLGLG